MARKKRKLFDGAAAASLPVPQHLAFTSAAAATTIATETESGAEIATATTSAAATTIATETETGAETATATTSAAATTIATETENARATTTATTSAAASDFSTLFGAFAALGQRGRQDTWEAICRIPVSF